MLGFQSLIRKGSVSRSMLMQCFGVNSPICLLCVDM